MHRARPAGKLGIAPAATRTRPGPGVVTRSLVLDVETRIDRASLATSGRSTAPRDMPAPLQVVTAVALLSFGMDASGVFSGFRLDSLEGAERDVATLAEQAMAPVHAGGGELVTYNGVHDLGAVRFALIRARLLGGGGAARWLADDGGRHRDLMPEVAAGGRWPRLADVAAGLRFAPVRLVGGPLNGVAKAELDVALTMLLHIHLVAEHRGDARVLARGALAFGRFLATAAPRRPHISAILDAPLYANASRTLAP